MSQLLKHYWLDRDNGAWATYTKFGLMMPRISGLEVSYNLTDENEIPFMLSTCSDDVVIEQVTPGIQVLTQQEWDSEIASYDSRQETKRYDALRPIRDEMLLVTDWIAIKSQEQSTILNVDFKTWRQALRDLPSETPFPTGFPTLPVIVENDQKLLGLYSRWSEIASIPMINDPLIPAP
jgi:hypothetical protein